MKKFEFYRNGTKHGELSAKSLKDAEANVRASFGENLQVYPVDEEDNDEGSIRIADCGFTNFVWLVVTEKAKEVFNSGLFSLYALHEDGSESLIEHFHEIDEYLSNGIDIAIEVGHIRKESLTVEDVVHVKNLLTYDDLDEDEKIASAIEFIDDKMNYYVRN